MRYRLAVPLGVVLTLALGSVVSQAQSVASRPNLSGLWQPVGSYTFDPADPRGARAADLDRYPMTPWGLEKFKANKPAHGEAQSERGRTERGIERPHQQVFSAGGAAVLCDAVSGGVCAEPHQAGDAV
jgi:hypothetical protein